METKKINAYFWNTVSSLLNAGMSAILLLVVNRVCGAQTAGIFTLAFSVAQLMMTIGSFEVRPYQVTDIDSKFSDKDYYNFKLFSCILMMIVSLVYSLFKGYYGDKLILVLLLCVFKMFESYEDYYVALYQKENNLGEGAKRSSIRVAISLMVFSGATIVTKNVYIGIICTNFISIALIVFFFVIRENKKRNLRFGISLKGLMGIAIACFPMFLGSYMALYVGNAPKYAIDELLTKEFQTIYGIIYMPSFVINLFSGFVFKPIINDMAKYYYTEKKKYYGLVFKSIIVVLGISAVVLAGGFLLGIPVLSLVYGIDLHAYRFSLMIILLGGMMGAFIVILYYIMMIKRLQQWLLVSYILTALMAMFTANPLVRKFGVEGASAAFFLFNTFRMSVILITMFICSKKEKNKSD